MFNVRKIRLNYLFGSLRAKKPWGYSTLSDPTLNVLMLMHN